MTAQELAVVRQASAALDALLAEQGNAPRLGRRDEWLAAMDAAVQASDLLHNILEPK